MVTLEMPRQLSDSGESATETAKTHQERELDPEDGLPDELMTCAGESNQEASAPTNLLSIKANTRIGTWNIRTLYEVGKAAQVAKEMARYNIKILGLSEVRWNERGQVRLESGETIIYYGHEDQDHAHTQECYAPINAAEEQEKDEFYAALQSIIDRAPRRDINVVMGDLNAKVGDDNTNKELIMGKHGIGNINENEELIQTSPISMT
nr:craniofacial development protein 2-like [Crassostrea gigas]